MKNIKCKCIIKYLMSPTCVICPGDIHVYTMCSGVYIYVVECTMDGSHDSEHSVNYTCS